VASPLRSTIVVWDVMHVKSNQVDQLDATVPSTINPGQRQRLDAYVDTVRRCEARIQSLRGELHHVFEAGNGVTALAGADATTGPNRALDVACELDTLERVQPRVDAWLKQYVATLISRTTVETYGDG
jgi:hypothetical protein